MEKNILKIIKLADILNEKQDKVFVHIEYQSDSNKKLEITIRSTDDYSYVERCKVNLAKKNLIEWKNIIQLLESYVGGMSGE